MFTYINKHQNSSEMYFECVHNVMNRRPISLIVQGKDEEEKEEEEADENDENSNMDKQ